MNLAVALRAALGVAETTTEESLLTHVASLSVREPDPTKYVSLAALSAEQSAHATVRTQLAALQTQINTAALDAEIKTAREAGAVLTAEYEADVRRIADQMGVPVAKSMLSALPRAAALAGKTQTGGMVPSGAAAAGGAQGATAVLSASQKTMCAILGVQEDQYINEVERLKRVTVAQTGDDDNG